MNSSQELVLLAPPRAYAKHRRH